MKLRPLVASSRGLAAAAVAALALGIGITALMFAIVDGTVRRGLPVARAAEIVHLERVPAPGGDRRTGFLVEERAWLEQSGALSAAAGYRLGQTNVAGVGLTPRRWDTAFVTGNTFAVLGVNAAQGRAFDQGTSAADGVLPLLISDDVWRVQFGAETSAVGRAVRAGGVPAVIAGVMPPGFRFPFNQHLWIPIDERAGTAGLSVWGRRAAGVSDAEAGRRLTTSYQQASAARGAAPAAPARVTAAPFTRYLQGPDVVQLLDMMFLAGLGVLAIACANVANLLLARGLARRRDFAIAGALGASRARLMRDRLLEGLALALPGAIAGVLLTYAGAGMFTRAIASSSPPYWVKIVVDARVLAYASAVTVLSALAAAALPSWRSGSAALSAALSDEARGTTSSTLRRTTAALVIVEIALATGVLIAAGLMTKGIARLGAAEYAFAVGDVTTGRVSLPAQTYPDADRRRAFFTTLFARLRALPGTEAAMGSSIPFAAAESVAFSLDRGSEAADDWPQARRVAVSPAYFSTLGVRLVGGRDFETADGPARAPVAIVNLSFALKHARREDLIGRTIRLGSADAPPATIVGVAPDLAVGNPRGEQPEAVYIPLFQHPNPPAGITVLARGGTGLEPALRGAVAGIDPDLPLDRVLTLAMVRERVTWFYRVFGLLFLAFGLGALVLALVGVYAVMSFGVTQRRREIGTRMAFGATGGDIARMFLREGSWRLALGLAAGGLLAAWLTPRLSLFLFRVSPRDPAVFAAALAVVAAVGLAACAVPAWRAARQDPNASLRDA